MKHMMLYESWRKKPLVLLLHGLDGSIDNEQLNALEELGYDVLSLSLNYRQAKAWEIIKNIEVDGVIGHSLGGYLAYYFSNLKEIPCLMFMPDFGKEMHDIQPLEKSVLDLSVFKNKIAVTGTEDEDVDIETNNKILKGVTINKVKSDHMPSLEIFKKYAKEFKKLVHNKDKSIGKLGKGKSVEDIAKMHKVSVKDINTQIEMGKKVELEHTDDIDTATKISKDHLVEDPEYYTKLKKVEED